MAGLTGAVVVLPQGVVFATIAGMPPEYGLYAAMVPAIIAALFGSSRFLVSGPTTAASIVLYSSLSVLAIPGTNDFVLYALTLTFMVGVIQLMMGLARLGILVNFISHSVIVGFTAGAAILIATQQIQHFFGVAIPRELHFHQTYTYLYESLEVVHPATLGVGVFTLVTAIAAKRMFPRIPYMIVGLIAGSVLSVLLNHFLYAQDPGAGVQVMGGIPVTLPPLSSPDFSLATIRQLAPAAFAMTLLALTEAVTIARSLAARRGHPVDGNQEFIGQGLSNIIGSFFSAYVATGSFNRSALNFEAGAKTPVAAAVAGTLLIPLVIVIAPLLAYLPKAGMAAILFVVAWTLVDFNAIGKIVRASRAESVVLWATFFATLFFHLEFAILLGVFLSLVIYLLQASKPRVVVRMPDPRGAMRRFNTDASLPECPQLRIVRIDGSLFFGAVSYVAERLRILARRNPQQKHLLIFARTINTIDVAGAELLVQVARERRQAGGGLYMSHLQDSAVKILSRGGYLDEIGPQNLFDNKAAAIAAVFERLDRNVCAHCDKRVFKECQSVARAPEVEVDDTLLPEPERA